MAAVDFDMNFLYVLPGGEGSAHDSRVLNDALEKGFSAPPGRYYLADAGYICREWWYSSNALQKGEVSFEGVGVSSGRSRKIRKNYSIFGMHQRGT